MREIHVLPTIVATIEPTSLGTKQARFSTRVYRDYDKDRCATQFHYKANMTEFVANIETLLTLHLILQQVYIITSSHTTTRVGYHTN
jgi:uncharacterized protein YqhQ